MAWTDYAWEILTALLGAGILGLTWEIYRTRRDEAEARAREAESTYFQLYDELAGRYLEFLALCAEEPMAHANLNQEDVADLPPALLARRTILYEFLFAVLERAYIYRSRSPALHQTGWPEWDSYLRAYLRRPSFRREVEGWMDAEGGLGMNPAFERYVASVLADEDQRS
jgi:hypothetical protein